MQCVSRATNEQTRAIEVTEPSSLEEVNVLEIWGSRKVRPSLYTRATRYHCTCLEAGFMLELI